MRVEIPAYSLLIAAAVGLACGCASSPPAGDAAAVQVFEANPYVGKPYEVLGPLWADSWRTAYRLPTFPKREEAVAALQSEAARLNADALISVSCLDYGRSTWFRNSEPGFICYGVAIRLPRSQG